MELRTHQKSTSCFVRGVEKMASCYSKHWLFTIYRTFKDNLVGKYMEHNGAESFQ